ncbi:hypothetical protein DPMN_193220 [Dreissena polymorpha]|uniref:Uncharacterized protein n=1 Tax=Dreissena polymorpha TaxID=45954 RepID=A0A9D3Y6R4_DREPO|nr:hypothetical protein DPMN_193220 [Dreissena polymorpha]
MNLLTKFHEDRTVNVASRVKNAPPLGSHTNLLTKFHEDWTINVASREKCPAPGGHVFKATKIIFDLIQDIIVTNLLTKFHDDQKINVTSRVLTRNKNVSETDFAHLRGKTAPPPCGHFHDDWANNVTSRVSHVIQLTGTIFELNSRIKEKNMLTKFHENWAKNVTSRKNAPPTNDHVFSPIWTIFELTLCKFGKDRTKNVEDLNFSQNRQKQNMQSSTSSCGHVF